MDFVQNNLLLILVAFASGAMLIWPTVRRNAGGPWVDTLRATQMINREDAVVVDVREVGEYARVHILGARNLPLGELERRVAELEKHKSKPLILCCDSGNRSGKAISILRQHGFERVQNLSGGFGAWQQAGLPVEK